MSACFPSGPMAKRSRRLEMRAGCRTMGKQRNKEGTVSSPSVARCHAEEPEGIWFDLGFLKHGCGLTNSFGDLITSSCCVSHWSPFLRALGNGETEARGGDSGDVTPGVGTPPGRALSNSAFWWREEGCAWPGERAPNPTQTFLRARLRALTPLLSSGNRSSLGNFTHSSQAM